jgi:hypothetical protein
LWVTSKLAAHELQPVGPHGSDRARTILEPTPSPDKASGTPVRVSTIVLPARRYSTNAVLPPLVISHRLAAGLSLTFDMGAR